MLTSNVSQIFSNKSTMTKSKNVSSAVVPIKTKGRPRKTGNNTSPIPVNVTPTRNHPMKPIRLIQFRIVLSCLLGLLDSHDVTSLTTEQMFAVLQHLAKDPDFVTSMDRRGRGSSFDKQLKRAMQDVLSLDEHLGRKFFEDVSIPVVCTDFYLMVMETKRVLQDPDNSNYDFSTSTSHDLFRSGYKSGRYPMLGKNKSTSVQYEIFKYAAASSYEALEQKAQRNLRLQPEIEMVLALFEETHNSIKKKNNIVGEGSVSVSNDEENEVVTTTVDGEDVLRTAHMEEEEEEDDMDLY